ncbi:N utilization substance protein B homolog (fragment) [Candidatus Zixiibacteriota bacterium]
MSNRHRAREYVLKALYAFEQGGQTEGEIAVTIIGQSGLDDKSRSFAEALYFAVIKNLKGIDKYIAQLATNWKIERIAIVDKNILRMAICEVEHMPDIPVKVAIDEAIELAKKYSTLESASFVNGILDRVLHEKT